MVALAIWCIGITAFQSLTYTPRAATSQPQQPSAGSGLAATISTPPTANPATFASVVHAKILPSGPSGQLLPPGSMAPDRTYPNSYARGQCTWYVAGRRQIPSNWGNAAAWYYHASASKWSIGTTPAVAAIAWSPAYSYGSSRYGHVALVEQVSADGARVYISEMNYRGIGVKSFRWEPASHFKYIY